MNIYMRRYICKYIFVCLGFIEIHAHICAVSKGVLDVMRERPDSERALNLELWMSYAHALGKVRKYAFCVDVEYVLRTAVFFNKIYESKGIRPLWLIGGE